MLSENTLKCAGFGRLEASNLNLALKPMVDARAHPWEMPLQYRWYLYQEQYLAHNFSSLRAAQMPGITCKVQFTDPDMFAKIIVLDGERCRSMSDWVWRSTESRAMDHCVESICSCRPKPRSDEVCLGGLGILTRSLLRYLKEPDDMEARLDGWLGCN